MKSDAGRKHPAHMLPIERHNEPIIIFLTVCAKDRKQIFATSEATHVIVQAWQNANSWSVGRYVIMPDHIHLFCSPARFPREPLGQWVRFWKNVASRKWPRPDEHPVWQRDFWDTQLRREENYDQKWEYVLENPVRAGLVGTPEEWPFRGELNVLRW
jgi:REP element-mobilizing transposase RayT